MRCVNAWPLSTAYLDMWAEYLRPWKLATLAAGILLLVLGAFRYHAPDWDVPISLIMAAMAYLTAPWSMRVMLDRQWQHWPVMLWLTWFSVDGCYVLYWSIQDPVALAMRAANFPASLSLYWMCGVVWLYKGSIKQLIQETKYRLQNAKLFENK